MTPESTPVSPDKVTTTIVRNKILQKLFDLTWNRKIKTRVIFQGGGKTQSLVSVARRSTLSVNAKISNWWQLRRDMRSSEDLDLNIIASDKIITPRTAPGTKERSVNWRIASSIITIFFTIGKVWRWSPLKNILKPAKYLIKIKKPQPGSITWQSPLLKERSTSEFGQQQFWLPAQTESLTGAWQPLTLGRTRLISTPT